MKKRIGNIIARLRKEQKFTQEYVAYKVDITVNSYANIERGRVDVNISRLHRIADVLNTKAYLLLALADNDVSMLISDIINKI